VIFIIVEVPQENKVKVENFYLMGKTNIWWSTIKDRQSGPDFTWNKFMKEMRVKFYLVIIQRQKEKEFIEMRVSDAITIMQYASKFTELS